jgi:N-acetylmuramoyl-L-alanine amidase
MRMGVLVAIGVLALLCAPLMPLPSRWAGWQEEADDDALARLAELTGRATRAELQTWLPLVDPEAQLGADVALDDTTLELREAQIRLPLADATPPRRLPRRFTDLVVVLDPGHRGGAWSEIEKRHTVLGGPAVREGDLTYATALLLRDRLVRRGARVLVTRGPPPTAPFPEGVPPDYDAEAEAHLWLAESRAERMPALAPTWPSLASSFFAAEVRRQYSQEQAFELWNRWDLRTRIALAESAGADVFLSLHYNMIDGMGKNGVLVFVPGNFMAGELATRTQRFYATRLLASGLLRDELLLARVTGVALQRAMQLPPIAEPRPSPDGKPPNRITIDAAAGVYARNLGVLRRAATVALLLEGPCMNELGEYSRLSRMVGAIEGVPYPERAVQYASAVDSALSQVIEKTP